MPEAYSDAELEAFYSRMSSVTLVRLVRGLESDVPRLSQVSTTIAAILERRITIARRVLAARGANPDGALFA